MHTLAEVNRIKHLDFVALLFLQEMAYLGEHPAFRIYAHIRRVGLKELRGQPEPGLARAGRADNTAIQIAGVGRYLGPGVHGEKLCPGENDVVFKLGIGEGGYILGGAPPCSAVGGPGDSGSRDSGAGVFPVPVIFVSSAIH